MDEPTGQCSNCLQWHETDDCPCDTPEERMIDSLHDELRAERNETAALRTRLESTEAARRDAQESRFALIVQNEELGAELAATRARLESAEAALRFYGNPDNWFPGVGINRGLPCSVEADEGKRARAEGGAAGEQESRSDG